MNLRTTHFLFLKPSSKLLILFPFIESRAWILFRYLVHVYKYIDNHATLIYLTKLRILNHYIILLFVHVIKLKFRINISTYIVYVDHHNILPVCIRASISPELIFLTYSLTFLPLFLNFLYLCLSFSHVSQIFFPLQFSSICLLNCF